MNEDSGANLKGHPLGQIRSNLSRKENNALQCNKTHPSELVMILKKQVFLKSFTGQL